MTEVKNILLIGRTGSGKSTLGNVLLNENDNFEEVFETGDSFNSITKETASFEVAIGDNEFRIFDTAGFDHTSISESEVLEKLSEVGNSINDLGGFHQILWIRKGRFSDEDIKIYDLLASFMTEEEIRNYVTMIITNFPKFENEQACEEHIQLLKGGGSTNSKVSQIVNQVKIIHVNNPPFNVEYDFLESEEDKQAQIRQNNKSKEKWIKSYDILWKNLEEYNSPFIINGWQEGFDKLIIQAEKEQELKDELNKDNNLKHSYNDLLSKLGWNTPYPDSLNSDPDENIYTGAKFRQLQAYFLLLRLDNPICKKWTCLNADPLHIHQEQQENENEIKERAILYLENVRKDTVDNETQTRQISQIISLLKGEKPSQLEGIRKLINLESDGRATQYRQIGEKWMSLIQEEINSNKKGWPSKIISSPWTWFLIIGLIGWLIYRRVKK